MILLDISSWWQAMTSLEKTFWVFALLFSFLFLLQSILSFIGGDAGEAGGN